MGRRARQNPPSHQQQGQSGRALSADGPHAVSQSRPAPKDDPDAGLVVIAYEANYGLRYIFTDGRTLPTSDAQPWWYGYSVGRWEGDTLVVETTGFRDGGWLDIIGNPLTDAAKVIERFRRPNYGTLEIDVTIDDAKAYTKPWTVRVNQRILLDGELMEFICLENQQFESFLKGQK